MQFSGKHRPIVQDQHPDHTGIDLRQSALRKNDGFFLTFAYCLRQANPSQPAADEPTPGNKQQEPGSSKGSPVPGRSALKKNENIKIASLRRLI